METINIALASDDNYAQHVAVVMASVMGNCSTNEIHFYILSDDISEENKLKILQTSEILGCKVTIIELSERKSFEGLYTSGHISRAAYFRLDIANLLPQNVHKVVYLDVDLIVYGDIVELWGVNLDNKPLAAVPDLGIMSSKRLMKQKHKLLGINVDDLYFNSGVLILDLEQWRRHGYSKMVIDIAAAGSLPHHDQDALNKVFYNLWKVLPLKWNVIPPVFNLFAKILWNDNFRKNAIEAKKRQCIMHFAGRYKPWEFGRYSMFNDGYYSYLSLTAFKGEKMPKQGDNMKGKSVSRALLRLYIADFWAFIFD